MAETLRVKFDLPLVLRVQTQVGSNGEEIRFVGREVVVSVDPEFGAETMLVIDWTPGEPVRPEKPKKAASDQRPYSDGPVVCAVDIDMVRMDYYRHVLEGAPGSKQDTRRKAFARAMEKARKDGLVQFCEMDERGSTFGSPIRPWHPDTYPGEAPRNAHGSDHIPDRRDRTLLYSKCPGCPTVRIAKMHGLRRA